MFRPQIQRTEILALLAFFCIFIFYFNQNKIESDYNLKLKSANIMREAIDSLKIQVEINSFNPDVNDDIDPNSTSLIFNIPDSEMKTDSGYVRSKQTVLKPNFAALLINIFKEAGLKEGDTIAVGMTGSMPGANIALYAACKAMDIVPLVITSIGASDYGALHEKFTWLDMEKILYDKKFTKTNFRYYIGCRRKSCQLGRCS